MEAGGSPIRFARHEELLDELPGEYLEELAEDLSEDLPENIPGHPVEDLPQEPLEGLPTEMLPEDPAEDLFEESGIDEAIRYAYEHKLTTDYTLSSFSITHLLAQSIQSTIPPTNEDDFTDCSHLAELEIPAPSPFDNALSVTGSSLKLIYDACHVLDDDEVEQLSKQVCHTSTVKPPKLELPILRTDNGWDVIQHHKENLARHLALLDSIKKHTLPLDMPDVEKGEGMELSPEVRAECQATMKEFEEEKLGVTRERMVYLVGQIKDDYTHEDQMAYMVEQIKCEGAVSPQRDFPTSGHPTSDYPRVGCPTRGIVPYGPEKVTPPVSPKLSQNHPMPAFEPHLFPMPSDPSSIFSDNFHAIEDAMLADHQDAWSENTSPIRGFLEDDLTIPDQEALLWSSREQLEDFKVEVPLMLDTTSEPQAFSGPGALKEFVDAEFDLDPEFESAVLQGFSDDNLAEQIVEAAGPIIRSIEQEQLQAIDAIGRVPVPAMDFSIPEPEWIRLCNDERAIFKWLRSADVRLFNSPNWPRNKAAESRLLWLPLLPGAIAASEIENMNDGEPLIREYSKVFHEEANSSLELVKNRHTPAVLEDEDGDEEIEIQLTGEKPTTDLMRMVRKRAMDVRAEGVSKKSRRAPSNLTSHGSESHDPSLLAGDSSGASATLLANFMELHAPKKKSWKHSKYFASQKNGTPTLSALTETSEATQSSYGPGKQVEKEEKGSVAPCPTISPPSSPLTIFISIKIPRRMIRTLASLVPELILLERDYDAHNTSSWRPGSVSRTEVVPALADDADITVSPTTGIIITSMIMTRQKPRAGTTKTMMQIRVEKASLRYDQLIILVGGEGGSDDTMCKMSSSDSTALVELQGYASGLDCNVQVHYVGGGDKTLAHWVAASIYRHSVAEPAILSALLEVETLWEVFLRRAGFNVFASQTVACQLKQLSSETETEASSKQHGVGAFVTMTRSERLRRFGQLVGPRVLERVSKTLDELWNDG